MVHKALSITQKKQLLDKHRPFKQHIIDNLREWFKIELTYSSNALEGNTLSRFETAVVVQNGITIGGKLLREHLEATNHAEAFDFVMSLVGKKAIAETHILEIHRLVLQNIETQDAGIYRKVPVRIAGSNVVFPNYLKIPELMKDFVNNINAETDPVEKAMKGHYDFVTTHPFIDGNGRTARLVMNLLLMQSGYPPAIIKPQDRLKYLKSLELAQLGGSKEPYREFMIRAIDRSLSIYIDAIENKDVPQAQPRENLIRIGEVARLTGENVNTIRYWAKMGLIEAADKTNSGYQLFEKGVVAQCKRIRELQKERLSLEEILIREED